MGSERSHDLAMLYAAPLAEFTRRRNELVARLQKLGRRDEAAAVRRLKKPSAPLWAINAVARDEPDAVRAFVDATDRLKRSQKGDRSTIVEATKTQRGALQDVVRSTEGVLRRTSSPPTARTIDRISRALLGAAADGEARQALLEARLTEERPPPGFEALAGVRIRAVTQSERPRTTTAPTSREPRAVAGVPAAAAREARRAAEEPADDLARKARELEEAAAARKREATEANRAVTELEQRLRDAERQADERERAAARAESAAKLARREASRALARARRVAIRILPGPRGGRKR